MRSLIGKSLQQQIIGWRRSLPYPGHPPPFPIHQSPVKIRGNKANPCQVRGIEPFDRIICTSMAKVEMSLPTAWRSGTETEDSFHADSKDQALQVRACEIGERICLDQGLEKTRAGIEANFGL